MSRRKRRWLWSLALCTLLVAALWAAWPRDRMLLSHASPVCNVGTWYLNNATYHWLPDGNLLFFRKPNGGTCDAYTKTVKTGQETRLGPLSDLLTKWRFSPGDGDLAKVSSDGQRLLWTVFHSPDDDSDVCTSRLDGSQPAQWKAMINPWSPICSWLPDSRHWAKFVTEENPATYDRTGKALVLRDAENGESKQISPLSPGIPMEHMRNDTEFDLLSQDAQLLVAQWYTDDSTAVPDAAKPDVFKAVVLIASRTPGNNPAHPTQELKPPAKGDIYRIKISPDGNRLAWVIRSEELPPTTRMFRRVLPFLKAKPQPALNLWVTRLDGTEAHNLGRVDIDPAAPTHTEPRDFQWMPDGKRISFLLFETLYTVAAD